MKRLSVTVDQMAFNRGKWARVEVAAAGLPIDFGHVTSIAREAGTDTRPSGEVVRESFVIGRTPLGTGVLTTEMGARIYETILSLASGSEVPEPGLGSFPKPGYRDVLTPGQDSHVRDAMLLEAHVREGRDILVSDDTRAFGGGTKPHRMKLRQQLEALCSTRIMTIDEFCAECDRLRAQLFP